MKKVSMTSKLNLSKWNILVVDDDAPSISLIEAVFKPHKAHIYSAASGNEALEKLKNMPCPKLILCDIQMYPMDGYILRDRIRETPSFIHTPIIAVTAQALNGDRERILAAGFDGYISKPYHVATFVYDIIDKCNRYIHDQE